MKITISVVAGIALGATCASAADYRNEIMENVIDPCLLHSVQQSKMQEWQYESGIQMLKMMRQAQIESLVSKSNKSVSQISSLEDRKTQYKRWLRDCILGALEER